MFYAKRRYILGRIVTRSQTRNRQAWVQNLWKRAGSGKLQQVDSRRENDDLRRAPASPWLLPLHSPTSDSYDISSTMTDQLLLEIGAGKSGTSASTVRVREGLGYHAQGQGRCAILF